MHSFTAGCDTISNKPCRGRVGGEPAGTARVLRQFTEGHNSPECLAPATRQARRLRRGVRGAGAHDVREMRDDGPDNGPNDPTYVTVDHYPGKTDPDNEALVLESPDETRLARAVAGVNFLAGVSDEVLAGWGIDGTLPDAVRHAAETRWTKAVSALEKNARWPTVGGEDESLRTRERLPGAHVAVVLGHSGTAMPHDSTTQSLGNGDPRCGRHQDGFAGKGWRSGRGRAAVRGLPHPGPRVPGFPGTLQAVGSLALPTNPGQAGASATRPLLGRSVGETSSARPTG